MRPRVCIFTICKDEVEMMPYFLKHYSTFADKIIVMDEQSTDGTREIIKACPIAELRDWLGKGLDDERFIAAVNHFYFEARGDFDWVAWPDVDELLHHPHMLDMLAETKADMLQATAYGMISETRPAGLTGQIYDTLRMGVRQPNYDKFILWRPDMDIEHQHGRHTYEPDWPKCSGTKALIPGLKLLHYHYFGVEATAARNQRNYDRALEKRFAWNYAPKANADPKQPGSVAWVKAAIDGRKLVEVIPAPVMLKKLHLGAGGREIEGWESHDMDVDLRKPLPFAAGSASHVFAEHVVEHLTHREAWSFFEECYRVLARGGIVRIAVPDLARLQRGMTREYQEAVRTGGHGDGSAKSALRAVVFEHGHKSAWNQDLLDAFLEVAGFKAEDCLCGQSTHPELDDIEQHWKTVGRSIAELETSVVEGTKL